MRRARNQTCATAAGASRPRNLSAAASRVARSSAGPNGLPVVDVIPTRSPYASASAAVALPVTAMVGPA
jgi:hypothetical protein